MYEVVEKKFDKLGRIVVPREWLEEELSESREAWLVHYKGAFRIIPKPKGKLTDFFDKGKPPKKGTIDPFEDWKGALAEAGMRG